MEKLENYAKKALQSKWMRRLKKYGTYFSLEWRNLSRYSIFPLKLDWRRLSEMSSNLKGGARNISNNSDDEIILVTLNHQKTPVFLPGGAVNHLSFGLTNWSNKLELYR